MKTVALVVLISLLWTSPVSSIHNESCTDSFYCSTFNLVCLPLNGTNTSFCGHCTTDQQCVELYGSEYECLLKSPSLCYRKPLWPLDWHDYVSFFILFLGGSIAAGGGIGGGGVFIPVLILLGGFRMRDAIPLSNVMIGGSSIASVLLVLREKHPLSEKPLIEYDLSMLMQPLALSGTVVGVVLNSIFPDWVILILLILVLLTTTYRTTKKGVEVFKKERKSGSKTEKGPLIEGDRQTHNINNFSQESLNKLQDIYDDERRNPFFKQLILFVSLTIVVVHSLLIGGKGTSIIGIAPCTPLYWALFSLVFPVLFIITAFIIRYLISTETKKIALDYKYLLGDIHWNKKNSGIISLLSFGAGILSSLLGIGGGMILSPLMLELNVLPAVTAATSSYMILFTSLAAAAQYAILSRILWDYGGTLLVLGFISGIIGQLGLNWVVKKYNKMSLIIFTIVLIIGCSTILLGVTGGLRVLNKMRHSAYMGFNHYCPS